MGDLTPCLTVTPCLTGRARVMLTGGAALLEALTAFDDEFVALLEAGRREPATNAGSGAAVRCMLDTNILIT